MTKCALCPKKTETDEDGICLDCQQLILKALHVKVEFLDKEPYVKVIPKEKESLYDFVRIISNLLTNVEYNVHAVKHHSHSRKEVEVVNIE